MRVVFLDHTATPSGGEIALVRLLSCLESVDATVILAEDGDIADDIRTLGIPVRIMPLSEGVRSLNRRAVAGAAGIRSFVQTLMYSVALAKVLRSIGPDVVHANSLKSGFYGGLACKMTGIPMVWHVRDRISTEYLGRGSAILTRGVIAVFAHAIICNSRSTQESLGRWGAAGSVLPSVVLSDAFEPAKSSSVDPKTTTASQVGAIGMVGRLADWKGQDVALTALAEVHKTLPTATLTFVGEAMFGDVTVEAHLRSLVAKLGLDRAVTFLGFRKDVSAVLQQFDVVVHASTVAEPFGQVVVEAMAAGKAVVAAKLGGPAEIIEDGVDGLLFTPGSPTALAAAIIALLTNEERRNRIGAAAKVSAMRYAPENIVPKLEAIYLLLAANRRSSLDVMQTLRRVAGR